MRTLLDRSRTTRLAGPWSWVPTIVRVVTGAFFVSTSTGKFFDYSKEVDDFRGFDVPWPDVAVPVVGVVELVGGLLLIIGLLMRPAALALAGDMVGALATAGRVEGGSFHLVFPPILLVAMVFLVWAGPGKLSIDARLAARRTGPAVAP